MYRLLIVDDEPFIVEGLRMLFESASRHEFEIYTALSARDALTVLDCTRMDIVISDIHMFGMDGLELLETVKRLWSDCRVVMLTGYSDFEYVQTALNHGADAYVLKTQDDAELLSAVDKCVGMIEDARCTVSLTELANQAMQSSMAACEFLGTRYYLWHHAMKRLVPEIMISSSVLENIVCKDAEPVVGLVQMNTVLLKSTWSILRYSSLKDGEIPESSCRISPE